MSRLPLVVPVLRAGLDMLGAVLRLLPETDTGFIGVARNEKTFEPEMYMNSVPEDLNSSAYIVPGLGDAGDRLFGPA